MIHSIYSANGLIVDNGQGQHTTYVGSGPSDLSSGSPGEIRLLSNTLYIWANGYWNPASSGSTSIRLTPEILSILDWASHKMHREQYIEKLAEKYPSVKTAKEQLEIVMALVKESE
jgi:hypothetical protein